MNDALLQIGEVAERAGLSLRTVRYYEESGLLEPVNRTDGGFRLYADTHVERLMPIKRLKPLGFSVQQMRELLYARDALRAANADADAHELARQRLADFAAASSPTNCAANRAAGAHRPSQAERASDDWALLGVGRPGSTARPACAW